MLFENGYEPIRHAVGFKFNFWWTVPIETILLSARLLHRTIYVIKTIFAYSVHNMKNEKQSEKRT